LSVSPNATMIGGSDSAETGSAVSAGTMPTPSAVAPSMSSCKWLLRSARFADEHSLYEAQDGLLCCRASSRASGQSLGTGATYLAGRHPETVWALLLAPCNSLVAVGQSKMPIFNQSADGSIPAKPSAATRALCGGE
jgi:hypothetical protein